LLVFPAFIVILVLSLIPVSYSVYLSFTDYEITKQSPPVFIGLKNYDWLFRDRVFLIAFKNTLTFTFAAVGSELFLGMLLALLLNRPLRDRGFFRTMYLVPLLMPFIAAALIWKWMYQAGYGVINYLIQLVGLKGLFWLSDPSIAMFSIILVDIWLCTPFFMIVLLAGLQTIPQDLYDSAQVDGASTPRIFRNITLPMLKPVLLVVILLRTIDSLRLFDLVYALTKGGPVDSTQVLSLYTYQIGFQYLYVGRSSALSVVILLVSFVVSLFYFRVVGIKTLLGSEE